MECVDVLVIGAGASGLRLAIELAERGIDCLVVGKRRHGDAHTRMAAGGINAALGNLDPEDSWAIHAADTVSEGHFVCQPRAVELLAQQSPDRVRELVAWGCPFDRTPDGALAQRFFGAQTYRRTCYVGDCTGEAILRTLVERAEQKRVRYREDLFVVELLRSSGCVVGALGFDRESGRPRAIFAGATVLAAGGATAAYARSSSRRDENTGDAMGLALTAGAALRDMEFVQFHPTGMVSPPELRGNLVTEAVRGEGGRLRNARGERFMERYSPEHLELDARDVVARAIYEEIRSGRGTPSGGVHLDVSHVDPRVVRERLPKIVEHFAEQGIDITREPMEVAPTAHYSMGGVKVDFDTGSTDVPGLYAVGEATSGVHGANRLGGNSLAETLVFGRLTALAIVDARPSAPASGSEILEGALVRLEATRRLEGPTAASTLRSELGELLWKRAGIVRDGKELAIALDELEALRRRRRDVGVDGDPHALEEALNLDFALITGEILLKSALRREESRGAHFRRDVPETRPAWQANVVARLDSTGAPTLGREPVPPLPFDVERALSSARGVSYHLLE